MSAKASKITGELSVCLTDFSYLQQGNTKAQHNWLFMRRIYRWPMDFSHKGPVMRKAFPCYGGNMLSSVGRDTIIFYACTMEVWHISSYFVIRTRLKDDIWPHLTLFRLFCDPDRGQDDIWPHLTQFNTSRDRGQVENCAIEPCLTSLTHLKRHEW